MVEVPRLIAEVPHPSAELSHLICTIWKVERGIYTLSSSPTVVRNIHSSANSQIAPFSSIEAPNLSTEF
jgi:hypothetical protein